MPTNVPIDVNLAGLNPNDAQVLRTLYQTLAKFINGLGFAMAQVGQVTIKSGDDNGSAVYSAPFNATNYALSVTPIAGLAVQSISKATTGFTVTLTTTVGSDTILDYIAML
jgi:hypothetical protein